MKCPLCSGKSSVCEGRTPEAFLALPHPYYKKEIVALEALGLSPCYLRVRKCKVCEHRFLTVEIMMEDALAV